MPSAHPLATADEVPAPGDAVELRAIAGWSGLALAGVGLWAGTLYTFLRLLTGTF